LKVKLIIRKLMKIENKKSSTMSWKNLQHMKRSLLNC